MASRSLGSLTLDLVLKLAGFEQGMDRAARITDKRLKEMGDRAEKVGRAIGTGLKVAAGVAATAFTALAYNVKQSIDQMDALSKSAQKVGLPTEQFSQLAYAGSLADVSVGDLEASLGRLVKAQAAANKETSTQAKVFAALGIETKKADGTLRSSIDVLYDFADRFQQLEGTPEATAAGMALFGKSFQTLIPLLKDGSEGLRDAAKEADDLGITLSEEAGRQAEEFNDNLTRLGTGLRGITQEIASAVLPTLIDLTGGMVDYIREGDHAEEITQGLSTTLRDLGDAFGTALKFGAEFAGVLAGIQSGLANTEKRLQDFYGGLAQNPLAESLKKNLPFLYDPLVGQSNNRGALPTSTLAPTTVTGSRSEAAKAEAERIKKQREFQAAVNAALGGGGGGKKGGAAKLSEEDKEAKRLLESYDRLIADAKERVALFGVEGEAAKISYDIQHGSLKGLEPVKAAALVQAYEELDAMKERKELQEEADGAVKREVEAYESRMEGNEEYLEALRFEVELLGMSNEEQEKAIALSYLSKDATEEQKQAVLDLTDARLKATDQAKALAAVEGELSDAFYDVLTGSKSAKDAIEDFFDNLSKQILRSISDNWAKQIAGLFNGGGQSGGGTGGGWMSEIGGWLGSLFGGGRANGGWTKPGSVYEVNERGFEMASVAGRDYMMVGNQPVKVTPNSMMGGGGVNQTLQFMLQGKVNRETQTQIAQRVGRESQRSLRRNS